MLFVYKESVHKANILDRLFLLFFREFSDILLIRHCAWPQERERFRLFPWEVHSWGTWEGTAPESERSTEAYRESRGSAVRGPSSRGAEGRQSLGQPRVPHLECARPSWEAGWGGPEVPGGLQTILKTSPALCPLNRSPKPPAAEF